MAHKSVLTFYSLPTTVTETNFDEIWKKYVLSQVEGVCCKDVFGFDMNQAELVSLLKQYDYVKNKLLDDVKKQLADGAVYMFVASKTGEPVFGCYLADYIEQVNHGAT